MVLNWEDGQLYLKRPNAGYLHTACDMEGRVLEGLVHRVKIGCIGALDTISYVASQFLGRSPVTCLNETYRTSS